MLKGFETQVAIDAGKPLLSKEDTLKYIDIMEEKKMESLVKLQTIAKTMPMDQNQAQIIMETEKVRGFD
jgi:hypothetical protein